MDTTKNTVTQVCDSVTHRCCREREMQDVEREQYPEKVAGVANEHPEVRLNMKRSFVLREVHCP